MVRKTGLIRHCFSDIQSPQVSLEELFHYLGTAYKPCIVAIDEFLAIMDYPEQNAEALLRTYIQNCNNAWFVFSGSKRHMMGEMFSLPVRPFYQSASTMSLKAISFEAYERFISYHFQQAGKHIESEAIRYTYEMSEGTTWYIQKICNELYAMKEQGSSCGIKEVDIAINYAVDEKKRHLSGLDDPPYSQTKSLANSISAFRKGCTAHKRTVYQKISSHLCQCRTKKSFCLTGERHRDKQ